MNVLVIDVGGSHVKMLATGRRVPVKFESGKKMTPRRMMKQVSRMTSDWRFDVVSIGIPGAVGPKGALREPGHLGRGWVGFDFAAAFGKPVRVINDAAMQALGGYAGGRMLFLGMGTGLGSALVAERVVVPLELGCLPFSGRQTLAQRLGKRGLAKHGKPAWQRALAQAVKVLRASFSADYVVLGGGNARNVNPLPPGTRRGGNEDAFTGGFRLWEELIEPHDREPSSAWRVVR